MSERRHQITDDGALHRYRTEIPNTIIRGMRGRGLSLPARWLYVYLKSVAGDCGECWQNMTTLAAGAQLSRGAVSNARKELIAVKLIVLIKGKGALHESDHIRILDIWQQNMAEFATDPSSSGEREPSSLGEREETIDESIIGPIADNRVHEVNPASSSGERASSLHEQPSSSGELKKIPLKKIPEKKKDPPLPPKGGSAQHRKKAHTHGHEQLTAEEQEVLDHLRHATKRHYREPHGIRSALARGVPVSQLFLVIDWWAQVKILHDPKQDHYFDNETPFRERNFDKYLAAAEAWDTQGRPNYYAHGTSNGRDPLAAWAAQDTTTVTGKGDV